MAAGVGQVAVSWLRLMGLLKLETRNSEKTLPAFVEPIFDFQTSARPRSGFPLARE
jgi:hypothetical protein